MTKTGARNTSTPSTFTTTAATHAKSPSAAEASAAAELTLTSEGLSLKGAIDFYNVLSIYEEGTAIIKNLDIKALRTIKVDLKEVVRCDSSGLALLTAWIREAKEQKKEIFFVNMPHFMQDISKICGLEDLLPVLWEN